MQAKEEPKEEKKSLFKNLKGHTWWWLGAIIAFCVIMVIIFFALGRKDMVDIHNLNMMIQNQSLLM